MKLEAARSGWGCPVLSLPGELASSVLESAPDAMIIIAGPGFIGFANRQTSTLFGYSPEELIGQPVECLLPEHSRARHQVDRDGYLRAPRSRPMGAGLNLLGRRKDGTEFPVEISLSPIESDAGLLVAAAIRDITDRKQIEAEVRYLESIAETALSSESTETLIPALLSRLRAALHSDTATILLADVDGRYLTTFASDGLEAELGGELQIPIGRGVAGRIALSDGPVIFEDLSKIEVLSPVLRARIRSLIGAALKSGGHLLGVVHAGFSVPRTFGKSDARLLSVAGDRIALAIERSRLRESEQAARQAAEAANRQKSAFLSTASHDLRQPLQTIGLLNGSLRRLMQDRDASDALSAQGKAIEAMTRLLNSLLDISKLESGAVKPDPSDFAVNELFEDLRREFASLADIKGLRLEVTSCDDTVYSDPSLVGQILRNLASNAIKYTRAGWVALRSLHEQPSHVRIEVVDSGIGIPAEQLHHIYEDFYQIGVPPNTAREGYGLGLGIVQRLVRLLDAKLDVHSEVGRGSVFALTLPAGRTAARLVTRTETDSRPRFSETQSRVLLVEDDPAVLNATRLLLKTEGYRVTTALSMADALKQVDGGPPIDLLLTDYHLGNGETGTQVISALRAALNRPLKVILMTGDTSSAIASLCADSLMRIASKPVNAEELLSLVRVLLASN